ncbi:MAG: DUF1501 domain-containing protein [Pseudomonadales bacterium]
MGKAINRRRFLQSSLAGAMTATSLGASLSSAIAAPRTSADDRILVIVELSGGNDGLNSVVPYGDDAYYRHRPTIGIKPQDVLKLDDQYGLNPGMLGFERLWQSGDLAIVHGCGYANPSYSHFNSMAYWHTATPNGGDAYGWVGRLADVLAPNPTPDLLINIDSAQSLAVKSRLHTPVVFDDPDRFQRKGFHQQRELLDTVGDTMADNASARYLNAVALSARSASARIRRAWAEYSTPIDYGIAPIDLPKVAACIAQGMPTRLYYVAFRNNAFDTHVQQPALHRRLLSYACDGIHGFIRDMQRIGYGDKVAVLVFSEFGRRVPENSNLGTDHGSANVMFLAGKPVIGGHYGQPPSLTDLVSGDNLQYTVDFRSVYATAIEGWLQSHKAQEVLKGSFESLAVFG